MKQLLLPANATFNAAGKTITFATTIPASISAILHVTNVTTGTLMFQPQAGSLYTGTFSSPVLTVVCSTVGMNDTDKLEIFWDDGLSAATDTTLSAINAKTPALIRGAQPVAEQGNVVQNVVTASGAAELALWDFSGVSSNDIVTLVNQDGGRSYLELSADPTVEDNHSAVTLRQPFTIPNNVEVEYSTRKSATFYSSLEIFSTDTPAPASSTPIALTSIGQVGTTVTIGLATPFIGYLGDWVSIYGMTAETRLNLFSLVVMTISADGKTLSSTVQDDITIGIGTYSANGVGYLRRDDQMSGAMDGAKLRFTGGPASATAALIVKKQGLPQASVSNAGAQAYSAAAASPASAYTVFGSHAVVSANNRYMFSTDPESFAQYSKGADSSSTWLLYQIRTDVKPTPGKTYQFRVKTDTPKSAPVPVAKIQSISKAGSTTCTVTTVAAHNLTTGNYVTINGVRDQTNFINTSSISATVTGANTFTCLIAGTGTATSYGGSVMLTPGQVTSTALLSGSAISTAARAASGQVTLVMTSVSGANTTEYINIYGCRDNATGADIGIDGPWKISSQSGTTLLLDPIVDYAGVTRSPTGSTFSTTNCGGSVFVRTHARVHDLNIRTFTQNVTMPYGMGTLNPALAAPVTILGTPAVTQGPSTMVPGNGAGGWVVRPNYGTIGEIGSSSIVLANSPITGGAQAMMYGTAFQHYIQVTAVAGTSPTYDAVLQLTEDNTNWHDAYHFPRITGTGLYKTPMLPSQGQGCRINGIITGTGASFTRAQIQNIYGGHAVRVQRKIYDRAIVLTGIGNTNVTTVSGQAFNTANCSAVQLILDMGAIVTTAPQFKLQASDDNFVSFWDLPNSALPAVASSVVQVTVTGIQAQNVRAIITVAGNGATLNCLTLKAWDQ